MTLRGIRRMWRKIMGGTPARLLLTGPGIVPGAEQERANYVLAWGK